MPTLMLDPISAAFGCVLHFSTSSHLIHKAADGSVVSVHVCVCVCVCVCE